MESSNNPEWPLGKKACVCACLFFFPLASRILSSRRIRKESVVKKKKRVCVWCPCRQLFKNKSVELNWQCFANTFLLFSRFAALLFSMLWRSINVCVCARARGISLAPAKVTQHTAGPLEPSPSAPRDQTGTMPCTTLLAPEGRLNHKQDSR